MRVSMILSTFVLCATTDCFAFNLMVSKFQHRLARSGSPHVMIAGDGKRCMWGLDTTQNGISRQLKKPYAVSSPKMSIKVSSEVKTDALITDRQYLGFHHVEFWVGNAFQTATFFIARMGFEPVAYRGLETGSRSVATHVVQQGQIRFAFTSALEPGNQEIGGHQSQHGDGVRDVSFLVKDCKSVFRDAVKNGAKVIREPFEFRDDNGAVIMATIATYGDTVHTFVEYQGYSGPFLPGFSAYDEGRDPLVDITPSPQLEFVDHVVGNQPFDSMEGVCNWYSEVLGFRRFWSVDDKQVSTKYSSLRSIVMTDPGESIKMPINEPAVGLRKSQIEEFVQYYGGAGVQHIALRTFDIIHAVSMLKARGVKFLKVPASYYEDLRLRLKASAVQLQEDIAKLEDLNILVDFDEEGYLLQIFMRPVQDRPTLFLEIIQRRRHEGFGVGNFKALFESIEREQLRRGNL